MDNLEFDKSTNKLAIVIGIGGAGGNFLQYMYNNNKYKEAIDFYAINSDSIALSALKIPQSNKLLIGIQGISAQRADPEIGKQAAIESAESVISILNSDNYQFAFIVAGMGGGTGTGAGPVIAKLCKSMGIYTIAICTTPFSFEGNLKQKQATEGINNLKENVDNITVVSYDDIDSSLSIAEAFRTFDRMFLDVIYKQINDYLCGNFSN